MEQELKTKNKRKLTLPILAILGVSVLILAGSLAIYMTRGNTQEKTDLNQNKNTANKEKIAGEEGKQISFPNFSEGIEDIYFDPEDKNTLWLMGDGGLIKYNIEEKRIDNLISDETGMEYTPDSMVRVGGNIFVSYQGGFLKASPDGTLIKKYTVEDGLVSGSNIYLRGDPYNKNILWIGTFEGLSRFNINTEEFVNFNSDIVPFATKLTINSGVTVGKDYVWIVINANAHSSGGVARLDKASRTWKSWGVKSFGKERRIDFRQVHAVEDTAIVSTYSSSGENFLYDEASDTWGIMRIGSINDPLNIDEKIYFYDSEGIKYIRAGDAVVATLEGVDDVDHIAYSKILDKLAVFSKTTEGGNLTFYDPSSGEITDELLLALPLRYQAKDVIFANDDSVIFTHQPDPRKNLRLLAYTFDNDNLFFIEGINLPPRRITPIKAGRLSDNSVAVVFMPRCEFRCKEGVVFELSLNGFELLDSYTLPVNPENFSAKDVVFGASSQEMYFISVYPEGDVFAFNAEERKFEPANIELEDIRDIPGSVVVVRDHDDPTNVKYVARSNDGEYVVEINPRNIRGDSLPIKYKRSTQDIFEEQSIAVAEPTYNAFGWAPRVRANSVVFSNTEPDVVWVGTNRGLVSLNLNTGESSVFTGLGNNVLGDISVIFAGEKVVTKNPMGVRIYEGL